MYAPVLAGLLDYLESLIADGAPTAKLLLTMKAVRREVQRLEQIVEDNRVITAQAKSYAQALKSENDSLRDRLNIQTSVSVATTEALLRAAGFQ